VFIRMAKEGSTISGLMDSFAMIFSVSLQHGVLLRVICDKLAHTRFEPSGWTGNEKMGYAKSLMDYIGRWLQCRPPRGRTTSAFHLASCISNPDGSVTSPYGYDGAGNMQAAPGDGGILSAVLLRRGRSNLRDTPAYIGRFV
jgi:ribonucleoside-diphosphate reductase alpha chain